MLVSGCSWSANDLISTFHPELECNWPKWPELVAKELNMDLVNLSASGAGNEKIYSSISDYLTNFRTRVDLFKVGLVVAAWSQGHRRDWSENFGKEDVWRNDTFDLKGDLNYHVLKSIRLQFAYQNLCRHLNVPYVQFQMISLWRSHINKKFHEQYHKVYPKKNNFFSFRSKILNAKADYFKALIQSTGYYDRMNRNFLGWPGDIITNEYYNQEKSWTLSYCLDTKHRISDLDRHPNKIGNEKLAEEFLKRYKKFKDG